MSKPDVLVASDLPLQGPSVAPTLAAAVLFVLRSHGFRAGRYTVGYQSCDDSTARSQSWDYFKCAANARDYASAERLVAVIGPYDSPCAQIEIEVTNRASLGTLALISPSNTSPGLTRAGPRGSCRRAGNLLPHRPPQLLPADSPRRRPGSRRRRAGCGSSGLRRVDVLTHGEPYGDGLARGFRTAARHLGDHRRTPRNLGPRRSKLRGDRVGRRPLADDHGAPRWLRSRLGWPHPSAPPSIRREADCDHGGRLPRRIPQTLAASGAAAAGIYVSVPVVVDQSSKTDDWRLVSAFDATQPAPVPLVDIPSRKCSRPPR